MARINLLPWREVERKRRQREFLTAAALAILVTALGAFLVHMQIQAWIGDQEARNRTIEEQIAQLNRQIKEIEQLEETKNCLLYTSPSPRDHG